MTEIRKSLTTIRNYSSKFFYVSNQKSETIQEFVKRVRNERGLSTTQVAKNSGKKISSSYITRIENEPFKKVSPEKLTALALGLGITEEEIFAVARGKTANKDTVINERLENLVLKFGTFQPAKKRKAEVYIELLEREFERLANDLS